MKTPRVLGTPFILNMEFNHGSTRVGKTMMAKPWSTSVGTFFLFVVRKYTSWLMSIGKRSLTEASKTSCTSQKAKNCSEDNTRLALTFGTTTSFGPTFYEKTKIKKTVQSGCCLLMSKFRDIWKDMHHFRYAAFRFSEHSHQFWHH